MAGRDELLSATDGAGAERGAVAGGVWVSVADGVGMGVCVPGGDNDGVSLRGGVAFGDGELRRPL